MKVWFSCMNKTEKHRMVEALTWPVTFIRMSPLRGAAGGSVVLPLVASQLLKRGGLPYSL